MRTRATVDQGDALRRHYKTVVGIEPRIDLAALAQGTNDGVHIACHLLCLGGVERLLRMGSSHAQPDAHSKHKAFEFHTSLSIHLQLLWSFHFSSCPMALAKSGTLQRSASAAAAASSAAGCTTGAG